MERRVLALFAALLSLTVLAYSLLVIQRLFFGVAFVAATAAVSRAAATGDRERTAVVALLWGVVLAALWTGWLPYIAGAALVSAVAYLLWRFRGPNRKKGSVA